MKWKDPVYAEAKEGLFIYRVSSESKAGHGYNVQLDCNIDDSKREYNGRCDCDDFVKWCNPNFKKNGRKIIPYNNKQKNRTRCKHIEKAFREFTRLMLCGLAIERRKAENGE